MCSKLCTHTTAFPLLRGNMHTGHRLQQIPDISPVPPKQQLTRNCEITTRQAVARQAVARQAVARATPLTDPIHHTNKAARHRQLGERAGLGMWGQACNQWTWTNKALFRSQWIVTTYKMGMQNGSTRTHPGGRRLPLACPARRSKTPPTAGGIGPRHGPLQPGNSFIPRAGFAVLPPIYAAGILRHSRPKPFPDTVFFSSRPARAQTPPSSISHPWCGPKALRSFPWAPSRRPSWAPSGSAGSHPWSPWRPRRGSTPRRPGTAPP